MKSFSFHRPWRLTCTRIPDGKKDLVLCCGVYFRKNGRMGECQKYTVNFLILYSGLVVFDQRLILRKIVQKICLLQG